MKVELDLDKRYFSMYVNAGAGDVLIGEVPFLFTENGIRLPYIPDGSFVDMDLELDPAMLKEVEKSYTKTGISPGTPRTAL
jgi:hypothetical protein